MMALPEPVKNFMTTVQTAGFEIYAVGGSVRDLLLKRPTKAWDFTTNATPEQIQQVFPDSFYNNAFGTVGVKMPDGDIYEITPFRTEGKYSDVRHPDQVVWAKTLKEDLSRREFTISSLATDGQKIIDPYDGQTDLKNKIVRAVGNPNDRFSEDALRLMRAVRIATQLGFTIEETTFAAIKKNAALISQISQERIRDELIKILDSNFPADGTQLLINAGLLEIILPEFAREAGVLQTGTHHPDDVLVHSLKALRFCRNKSWVVRLATLLHDVGKPVTFKMQNGKATFYNHEVVGANLARKIADRLHLTREDREKLYMLVRWHMFTVSELQTDAAIRRFIRRIGPENTADMLDLRIADRLGSASRETSWRLEKFKDRIIAVQKHTPSVNDLAVDGHDVMEILGIGPGPAVGEILKILFEEILTDPAKNDRDYLRERLKDFSSHKTRRGAALKMEE